MLDKKDISKSEWFWKWDESSRWARYRRPHQRELTDDKLTMILDLLLFAPAVIDYSQLHYLSGEVTLKLVEKTVLRFSQVNSPRKSVGLGLDVLRYCLLFQFSRYIEGGKLSLTINAIQFEGEEPLEIEVPNELIEKYKEVFTIEKV